MTASNIRIHRKANWLIETPGRQQAPQFFHRLKPRMEIYSRKSLAHVERFAVTIKIPVVIGRKFGVHAELTGKQSAGERNSRQNSHFSPLGLRKKFFRWALPEAIEDDLHRLQIGMLHSLQRFVHLFDAHSVVTDFPRRDQIIQDSENFCVLRTTKSVDNAIAISPDSRSKDSADYLPPSL